MKYDVKNDFHLAYQFFPLLLVLLIYYYILEMLLVSLKYLPQATNPEAYIRTHIYICGYCCPF